MLNVSGGSLTGKGRTCSATSNKRRAGEMVSVKRPCVSIRTRIGQTTQVERLGVVAGTRNLFSRDVETVKSLGLA